MINSSNRIMFLKILVPNYILKYEIREYEGVIPSCMMLETQIFIILFYRKTLKKYHE